MKTIQTIEFDNHKRRVVVFQRDDGSFGFEEQLATDNPSKSPWIPASDHSAARFDTAARALLAARGRVPWLAEAKIDDAV